MQLSGPHVLERFITDGDAQSARPASYDLRVGKIIVNGVVSGTKVAIEPQQSFILVSKETVALPEDHVGYAMPKTSMCNDGILVLNTGIVDPGYQGLLSTTAINFDAKHIEVRSGDPFLRLVVHKLEPSEGRQADRISAADYIETRKADSLRFPPTFLDIPGQFERLSEKVSKTLLEAQETASLNQIQRAVWQYAIWSIGIAVVIAVLATWGTSIWNRSTVERAASAQARDSLLLDQRFRAIEARLPPWGRLQPSDTVPTDTQKK